MPCLAAQRDISDDGALGPVRLFAASSELDLDVQAFQRRERSPVLDKLLSRRVAVTLGRDAQPMYGPAYLTLLMFTNPGKVIPQLYDVFYLHEQTTGPFAEAIGVVGLSTSAQGIQHDPICALNISRILEWTRNCEQRHDACNLNSLGSNIGDTVAPKLLIDVGWSEQPSIRLVQTGGRQLDYVALSYCWGENQTGRITTPETVREMMQGISLILLPQTIQDAVTVVRKLRLRYLWVDALCIIQGQENTGDWAAELQKMGQIYNNADLTIAATSARAASKGLLSHRNRRGVPVDFKATKSDRGEGIIFFRESITADHIFTEDVLGSPLLKRAWVKQERLLSRRTVDFCSKKIFWTCRMIRYSEDGQQHSDDIVESAALLHCLRDFHLSMRMTREQKDLFQGLFFRTWSDLVQEYSTLQLKYERDRLPALAGIADIVSRMISDQYLSGIWKSNLSSGLLRNPAKYPAKLSGIAVVPSWSWASVIGPIKACGHNPAAS